jgi:hypothetical protein
MIVWQGWGFFIVFVLAIASGITNVAFEIVTGSEEAFKSQLGSAVMMLVAAILNYGFSRRLQSKSQDRVMIDKETGQEIILRSSHSLLFIPVKWWTPIFVVISALLAYAHYF